MSMRSSLPQISPLQRIPFGTKHAQSTPYWSPRMATHVLFDTQAAKWRKLTDHEPVGVRTEPQSSLRRARGFVVQDGELCVETRQGLSGMRGMAVALMLEFVAAVGFGCVFLVWYSIR